MATDGMCTLCEEQYTKQGMSNHLRACRSDHYQSEQQTLHLRVEGAYRPDYWVHFEVAEIPHYSHSTSFSGICGWSAVGI